MEIDKNKKKRSTIGMCGADGSSIIYIAGDPPKRRERILNVGYILSRKKKAGKNLNG